MLRRLGAVGLLLVVAVIATGNWLYSHPITQSQKAANFEEMIQGTASKPYVTRMLVPFALRTAGEVLPAASAVWLKRPLQWVGLGPVMFPDRHPELHPVHFFVWVYLTVGSLFLLGSGMQLLLRLLYGGDARLHLVGAAAAVAIWPLLACYTPYLYDPFTPTIVLWAFIAGLRRSWLAYFVLLVLAALHKETAVLIPFALAFQWMGQEPARRIAWRTGAGVVMVATTRLVLSQLVFRHSPGQAFEFHLLDHNLDYTLPYLFLPKLTLIAAVVVGLCLRDWGAKPRPAKALALLGLPLIALGTVAGYVDEIRQYSECYPGLVALAFPTVMASLGHDVLRKNHGASAGDHVAPGTSG